MIQTGLYLSVLGPSYVYVRYRCGRCRRMGEKLVEEGAWDPVVLQPTARPGEVDFGRYAEMGEITAEEVINFHYTVQRLNADSPEEAEQA